MERALNADNAADWVYRGEGAANLVLGYCGSSPSFLGKVLRVQKALRNGSDSKGSELVLSEHERRLWKEAGGLDDSTSKEILGQFYMLHVMSPLLGPKHVDAGRYVFVSREFLESVEEHVMSERPSWRVDAAKVNVLCDSALLISDHSLFLPGSLRESCCIAVEIKIAQLSAYDPVDLFSGSKDSINLAIRSLYSIPQNNFRIFFNGSLVFGGLGGAMDNAKTKANEAVENLLCKMINETHGFRLSRFLELVSETILQSGILVGLLKAQKLDLLDIEVAIHAYYNLLHQPCVVCKDLGDLSEKYSILHSLSLEESSKIVRDYLIAATAKDCSLMISFRPSSGRELASEANFIHLETTNQTFDYKAHFIDLDMKPLKKMVYYYELDQKIVNCYKKMNSIADEL